MAESLLPNGSSQPGLALRVTTGRSAAVAALAIAELDVRQLLFNLEWRLPFSIHVVDAPMLAMRDSY